MTIFIHLNENKIYFPIQNLRNIERQTFITIRGQMGDKHFQTNNYCIKYTKIEKSNKNKLNLKTLFRSDNVIFFL